jgi:hypothetical protein
MDQYHLKTGIPTGVARSLVYGSRLVLDLVPRLCERVQRDIDNIGKFLERRTGKKFLSCLFQEKSMTMWE